MARTALKQAAIRCQRTTNRRDLRGNHANVRSAWKRGTSVLSGRPRGLRLFHTGVGDLGTAPASAEALAKGLGVIAFIRRQHLHPLVRSAACAGPEVESIQQREDVSALVPMGWGRARGPSPDRGVREAVD